MPSGFVQDTNQLSPNFYRVVWVANTGTYPTADGNDNGAITPTASDNVGTGANQITALPSTLAKGKARARGVMRFRNVVNRISGLADCQILDIEVGGQTNGDSQATSLAFTVRFDRDAGVVAAVTGANNSTTAVDGLTTVNTVALALKDQFVRGFRDATTASTRVTDGTNEYQLSITVAPPDSAADIWADTTVTRIDGTEVVTTDEAGAAE